MQEITQAIQGDILARYVVLDFIRKQEMHDVSQAGGEVAPRLLLYFLVVNELQNRGNPVWNIT